jgi:glycosyltransferase involved in cell wall biosynthesis
MSKQIRVALGATVLARGMASDGHLDGIGVYTRELLRTLTLGGSEVDISPVVFGNKPVHIGERTARALPLSFEASSAIAYLAQMSTPGSNRLSREVDLFHAPDHCIPRLRKTPVVASIMDVIPLTKPEFARSTLRKVKSTVFAHLARKAQHILTISEYSALEIEQVLGIPRQRITVTPLGVSSRYFEHATPVIRADLLSRYGLSKPYFLFVGTLQARKNVDRIVDAYEQLPTDMQDAFDLVIAGRSRPDMVSLTDRLSRPRSQGSVKWIQYVPDADLPILMQSATALVFPSLYEGFGLPVLEAFASRTPVITSNTTSLPEVAGGAAILVNPLAVEEVSDAMQRVAQPEAELALMVERAYLRAKEFTWGNTAALTLAAYRSVAG